MVDLEFHLKPSVYFFIFFTGIMLTAFCILIYLPWYFILKIILSLGMFFYSRAIFLSFVMLRSNSAIVRIRRLSNGLWLLKTKQQSYAAELMGESTVTNLVTVLLFRLPDQMEAKKYISKTCVIFKDALSDDQYRRLKVALNLHFA